MEEVAGVRALCKEIADLMAGADFWAVVLLCVVLGLGSPSEAHLRWLPWSSEAAARIEQFLVQPPVEEWLERLCEPFRAWPRWDDALQESEGLFGFPVLPPR